MPYAVHRAKKKARIFQSERAHPDDRNVKRLHHEDDADVGQEESWNGDQCIRQKGSHLVEHGTSVQRCLDSYGKSKKPGDERAYDEQRKRVKETTPDFF